MCRTNLDENVVTNDLPSWAVLSPGSNVSSDGNSSDICSGSAQAAPLSPIPISPHVNVPHTSSLNHVMPPPLPPRRREKKEFDAVFMAQIRQAPDAPQVIQFFFLFFLLLI